MEPANSNFKKPFIPPPPSNKLKEMNDRRAPVETGLSLQRIQFYRSAIIPKIYLRESFNVQIARILLDRDLRRIFSRSLLRRQLVVQVVDIVPLDHRPFVEVNCHSVSVDVRSGPTVITHDRVHI